MGRILLPIYMDRVKLSSRCGKMVYVRMKTAVEHWFGHGEQEAWGWRGSLLLVHSGGYFMAEVCRRIFNVSMRLSMSDSWM